MNKNLQKTHLLILLVLSFFTNNTYSNEIEEMKKWIVKKDVTIFTHLKTAPNKYSENFANVLIDVIDQKNNKKENIPVFLYVLHNNLHSYYFQKDGITFTSQLFGEYYKITQPNWRDFFDKLEQPKFAYWKYLFTNLFTNHINKFVSLNHYFSQDKSYNLKSENWKLFFAYIFNHFKNDKLILKSSKFYNDIIKNNSHKDKSSRQLIANEINDFLTRNNDQEPPKKLVKSVQPALAFDFDLDMNNAPVQDLMDLDDNMPVQHQFLFKMLEITNQWQKINILPKEFIDDLFKAFFRQFPDNSFTDLFNDKENMYLSNFIIQNAHPEFSSFMLYKVIQQLNLTKSPLNGLIHNIDPHSKGNIFVFAAKQKNTFLFTSCLYWAINANIPLLNRPDIKYIKNNLKSFQNWEELQSIFEINNI